MNLPKCSLGLSKEGGGVDVGIEFKEVQVMYVVV